MRLQPSAKLASRDAAPERVFGPTRFALTSSERAAAIAGGDRTVDTLRPMIAGNGVLYFVLGACQTYAGLGGTVRGHHLSSWYLPLGLLSLGFGAVTLTFVANAGWLQRRLPRRSRETTFAADECAISLTDGRARVVPWSRVQRVTDLGELFAIDAVMRRTYVPKRIFDDGGERFRALAMERLVGRRMLVGAPSRTVIVNTIARHR